MIRAKGSSWDGASDTTSNVFADVCVNTFTDYSGDGTLTQRAGCVTLSKGSAAAITLAAPVSGDVADGGDDGSKIIILTKTAQAHVVTCASNGFNGKGSSGTITFTAAIGNNATIIAKGGIWYVIGINGVTVA